MRGSIAVALVSATALLCGLNAAPVVAQTSPQATPPYALSVFAAAPAGLSAPDSIAVTGGHVFVGYGDGHAPDGSDGLSSQIVEFGMDGSVQHVVSVLGHSDGLKVNPATGQLWALQNEDANPRLVIFDPESLQRSLYLFDATPHGGGYDDMVFLHCQAYISASNPANNPNTKPAIITATLRGNVVHVEPFLAGNASATDILSDASVQLNLQDPDSMTRDPLGDIVLDSQADQELIFVTEPGRDNQRVLRLPLSYQAPSGPTPVEVDDTAFATSSSGFILFADKGLNTVYALKKNAFAPGSAYTAADGGPFVGTLNTTSGGITPIVTGLQNPGGLVFVDTSGNPATHAHDGEACGGEGDQGQQGH
ncbi:MAG TPA: hypothetical protein VGP48_10275 [Stellaceae bacterium]|jgi:hypothetical protein|nr:hypothetical protein [Stellaceae bacterium]